MLATYQQARVEGERCLQCYDAPCVSACPTHINVPLFIAMIRSGNVRGAAEVVKSSNALANVCGKVCPEEVFCQSVCIRGKEDSPIQIRELHFFATQDEWQRGYSRPATSPRRSTSVAVIGAGPAGLGCAFELATHGHRVDVFDGSGLGGVPRKTIPAFRLAESQLATDTDFLSRYFTFHSRQIGAGEFETLRQKYEAIFVAIGLGRDKDLGLPGEKLAGVFPVLEFLENAKLQASGVALGDRVVIIGGGNVSLDAAATARRIGASRVVLIYRRSEHEMRVWKSELEEARKQGVEIRFLVTPVEILGENRVAGVKCRRTQLSMQKDKSGRPIPVEIGGSDFVLDADSVIIAIGQVIRADWLASFERTRDGFLRVDDVFQTSVPKVFAGGDVIAGEGTVVQSVAHGKQAAQAIHAFLSRV